MKKNKMMRIASILLVVTLLSTCVISGTFAKYVTKAQGADKARVAKWGVLVSVDGGIFADKYETHDDTYEGEYSVVSSVEGEQIVAPGTSSDDVDNAPLVATVKGTPEVAARYKIEGKAVKDIVLPAGTYTDYTNYYFNAEGHENGYTGTFTIAKAYAPVKWDLEISGKGKTIKVSEALYDALQAYPQYLAAAQAYGLTQAGCSVFDTINIIKKVADNNTYTTIVENVLGSMVTGGSNFQLEADPDTGDFWMSYDFDPNKEMDFTFTMTWSWLFDESKGAYFEGTVNGETVNVVDMADTLLGNLIAAQLDGITLPVANGADDGSAASLEINAALVASATQID